MDSRDTKNGLADRGAEVDRCAQTVNEAMRQHWNTAVCKEFDVPTHYQSVAVLLVHWAERLDKTMNCGAETAELEELFKSKFGFTTKEAILDCEYQKPQNQLHLEIMKFMAQHDGPHRTHLLIVYYSGHGYLQTDESEQDHLYVSGTTDGQSANDDNRPLHEPICHWQSAESLLRHATADVLTIMDSCYAAACVNKGPMHVTRSFETIAATHVNTKAPGPKSFTRALIKSLTDLQQEAARMEQRPFDTSRLHDRIRRHMRPTHNIPPLFNRNERLNARHICIAPVTKSAPLRHRPSERAAGVLHLQVVFSKKRELDKEETTKLGQSLADAARNANLDITALDWVRFQPSPLDIRITIAVTLRLKSWIRTWRVKRKLSRDQVRDRPQNPDNGRQEDERPRKRLRVASPTQAQSPLTPSGHV